MRKSVLSIGLALALFAGGPASAKQGDLSSLAVAATDDGSALDRLWSGMEVQVDSLWSELRPEIEKQRAHYFAPTGSPDSHWAEAGVDMAALLARAPGGVAGNVLYSDDPDGPVIHVLDAAVLERLTSGWQRVVARDFVASEGASFVSLLAVTPAHLLVSREAMEPVGKGYCPKSNEPAPADHMALYRDMAMPFDDASERDGMLEGAAFSTWTALSRTQTPRVCWTYVEVAPGVYESRSFDADGRPLGHMDEGTKQLRIVPVADLRAMLTAKAQPIDLPQDSASIR